MVEVALYGLLAVLSASAVGFLAYWIRGRVLEHRLAVLEAIAELSQRVAQLEHSIHASDIAPLDRKMESLFEKLKTLDARLAVLGTSSAGGRRVTSTEEDQTPREAVTDAMERRGFHSVQIVSEHALDSGPVEIRVEAVRNGVAVKGTVFVNNGIVAETRLTPLYELFP